MEGIVTRTLYIDGREIESITQHDGCNGDLSQMENLAAKLELHKQAQRRGNIGGDIANGLGFAEKRGPKAFQLKLKFLYVLAKELFLCRKPTVEHHVVCLCVERHVNPAAKTAGDTA
ncbi:MAG: hypothetical protein J6X62_04195 [Bacteroidales bacterium]|nr:hypothetical protein [Bacteroidales bacterium]